MLVLICRRVALKNILMTFERYIVRIIAVLKWNLGYATEKVLEFPNK